MHLSADVRCVSGPLVGSWVLRRRFTNTVVAKHTSTASLSTRQTLSHASLMRPVGVYSRVVSLGHLIE
jgi:hypothetical protein